jgi:hypothetical protein
MVLRQSALHYSQNCGLSLLPSDLAAQIERAAAASADPDRVRLHGLYQAMFNKFATRRTVCDAAAGVRAAQSSPKGMQVSSAPPRLVRRVLRIARVGGMTHRDLGEFVRRDGGREARRDGAADTGQQWHRYFTLGQPMRAATLQGLVWECVRRGWIDGPRTIPTLDSTLGEWRRYFSPPWLFRLRSQIRAAEVAQRAQRSGNSFLMEGFMSLVESDRPARNEPRRYGQAARRARARAAAKENVDDLRTALRWMFEIDESWHPAPGLTSIELTEMSILPQFCRTRSRK